MPFDHPMTGLAHTTFVQVNDGTSSLSPFIYDFDMVAYVIVGILGAIIWDIFSNLGEDYELIQRSSIGLPITVYFLSRIANLLCFILMVIFSTGVNVDCASLLHATHWTFAFGLSLTTLLLVLRARAVYQDRKRIANLLSVMWLGVVTASLIETNLGSLGVRQESSGRCFIMRTITPFIIAATVVPMANDIVLFCAITWKLMQNSHEGLTVRKGLMVVIFGRCLPSFSRTLLRDGQAYFLTTIVVSITTLGIFCFAPQTMVEFSALAAFVNVGVMHLMACKIYRKTRLGVRRPEVAVESTPSLGPLEFRLRVGSISNLDADNVGLGSPTCLVRPCPSNGRGVDLERQKISNGDKEEIDVAEGKIN